jgi:hypothetical protein
MCTIVLDEKERPYQYIAISADIDEKRPKENLK